MVIAPSQVDRSQRALQRINRNLKRLLQEYAAACSQHSQGQSAGQNNQVEVVCGVRVGDSVYTIVRRPAAHEDALSDREREIARLVSRGLANKEIARDLGISRHTVATHLRRVFNKLNVNSRAAIGTQCLWEM